MNSNTKSLTCVPPMSVLVLDSGDWNTLKVLRCLGQEPKIKIYVLSSNRFPMPRFSRYCGHWHYHQNVNDEDRLETIRKLTQRWKIDVLLPAALEGMRFLSRNYEAVSKMTAIPTLAKPKLIAMANDKWAFYQFLVQKGLPGVPTVYAGMTGKPIQVIDADSIEYPALLKPMSESGGFGIVRVPDSSDLERAWNNKHIMKGHEYILQSYIPAVDFSLSVCCREGEILAYTLYRALLPSKNPFRIGGLLEYINDEKVIHIGRQLVSAMKWDGVADIDFLVDKRDQTVKILEFNPRFWQSLLGGINAGVNFPLVWCLSALGINSSYSQCETARYASPSLFIKTSFSRLIGKQNTNSIRWRESGLRFICADPLPEIVDFVRKTANRLRRRIASKRLSSDIIN